MKTIYVFNGRHGAGKTTLAKNLAERYPDIFAFYPEIGRQVREEVSYNALQSGMDFDIEVMRRELERDHNLLTETKIPLVETWHIGNIGYLAARSPDLIPEYKTYLIEQLRLFKPRAIFVEISDDVFRSRITERIKSDQVNRLIEFYDIITQTTRHLYRDFNIPFITINNEGLLREVMAKLESWMETQIYNSEGIILKGKER